MKKILRTKWQRIQAATLLFFSLMAGTALSQSDVLYEAFTEALLYPCSFDSYVIQNQEQFNQDYQTCASQLSAYFEAIEDKAAVFPPEEAEGCASTYLQFLAAHTGQGVSAFLHDMDKTINGEARWMDTPSGQFANALYDEYRNEIFSYKASYYLQEETTLGRDEADKRLRLYRLKTVRPLLDYLEAVKPLFQCYYF